MTGSETRTAVSEAMYLLGEATRRPLKMDEYEVVSRVVRETEEEWRERWREMYDVARDYKEQAAHSTGLPDEWLLSVALMEAGRQIGVEMPAGHSWRELAMVTRTILAALPTPEPGPDARQEGLDLLRRWRDASLDGDTSDLVALTNETTDFLDDGESQPEGEPR